MDTTHTMYCVVCTQVNAAGIVNFNQTDNIPQETVYDNNTNTTETTENIETYYQNDKICIYNYNQLKQIGSDAYVYTVIRMDQLVLEK